MKLPRGCFAMFPKIHNKTAVTEFFYGNLKKFTTAMY